MSEGVIERLRQKFRQWILTEEERELVSRVDACESKTDSVHTEWRALNQALEHAEITGEHELESADILVLTGRNHIVQGAGFKEPIYISGNGHVVRDCIIESSETDRDEEAP